MQIKEITDIFDDLIPSPIWAIYTQNYYIPKKNNEFSTTELLDSPLRRRLIRQFYEQIEKRIETIHAQIFGILIHSLFEIKEFTDFKDELKHAITQNDKEKTFEIAKKFCESFQRKNVSLDFEGYKITGIYDLLEDNILYDFKLTSSYAITKEKLTNFEAQLQIYRYLIEKNYPDVKIEKLKNIFLLKDFSLTKKLPFKSPIVMVEYSIWTDEEVEKLLKERLALHLDPNPICTPEDMWIRIKYKVGEKEFSDLDKALQFARKTRKEVQTVSTEPIRCVYYCEVAEFCPQFQNIKKIAIF